MSEIKGIITAMQTAMHEDGSINEEELRRQIDRQIEAGVDAVFCLGTNGEFYIMSMEEKIRVIEIFVDQAKGVFRYMRELAVSAQRRLSHCPKRQKKWAWMQSLLLHLTLRLSARKSCISIMGQWQRQ